MAWFISIGQTVDTDVTPVTDSVMLIQNSHFVPQSDLKCLWAAAMSTTLSRARFASPKTRQVTNPWIRPIIQGSVPPTNPNVRDWLDSGFQFKGLEEIQLLATSGLAMGNENFTAIASLGVGIQPAPQGDYYPLRGTSTTAAVANKWSQITVTWQDTLPAGTYAVVGLEHQSANGQAARLIFQNQQYRPGAMSITSLANRQNHALTHRRMGVFGQFIQTAMPLVEVLANAADASHEIYMDIIRVG
ncbi:MAG TPA: hypothetical protein VFH56_16330 [Acidimicrobiales bacterium]|nr:hypothetical protein [Acidimicrobiales bacterium]